MFKIDIDTKELEKLARKLDKNAKQLPFAVARALTWTAGDTQDEVRARLPNQFTIRNNFVSNNIRVTPATKASLAAEVGASDRIDFMKEHETGGIKKPKRGEQIAVPITGNQIRPAFPTRVTPSKWLGKQIDKPKTFVKKTRRGNTLVMRRTTKKSYPVKILFKLQGGAPIKSQWDFYGTALETVGRRYDKNFTRSLDKALQSAR